MSVTVRKVDNPTETELDEWAKLLAEAFKYNFFGNALTQDKSRQEPTLRAFLAAGASTGEGEIHVAEIAGEGVVGVGLWFGPGHWFLDNEAQRNAGWNQSMASLPPEHSTWWDKFLKSYDAICEKALGPGVKRGAWHLQLLGTSPNHQRKGIGAALLRFGEKKAHADRAPTILETDGETNISIYKSLKYLVAGTGLIPVPPPDSDKANIDVHVFIKRTENDEYESA